MLRGMALDLSYHDKSISMPAVVRACQDEGLIVLRSGENVIRIAPPLVIPDREIDAGIELLGKALIRFI